MPYRNGHPDRVSSSGDADMQGSMTDSFQKPEKVCVPVTGELGPCLTVAR